MDAQLKEEMEKRLQEERSCFERLQTAIAKYPHDTPGKRFLVECLQDKNQTIAQSCRRDLEHYAARAYHHDQTHVGLELVVAANEKEAFAVQTLPSHSDKERLGAVVNEQVSASADVSAAISQNDSRRGKLSRRDFTTKVVGGLAGVTFAMNAPLWDAGATPPTQGQVATLAVSGATGLGALAYAQKLSDQKIANQAIDYFDRLIEQEVTKIHATQRGT